MLAPEGVGGRRSSPREEAPTAQRDTLSDCLFIRGGASAFIGNSQHYVPYVLKHTDRFEELPEKYYGSALIDRLHAYVPGWEIDVIQGEMFASGYGFVVGYLAEILARTRNDDHPRAQTTNGRSCRLSQRDGPHNLGHDDEGGELPDGVTRGLARGAKW